jgi:hypothetical protein
MKLWIVGKVTEFPAWEFQGVFDTPEKALAACKTVAYFVGPCELNATVPDRTEPWPGCEYPLASAT